MIQGMGRDRRSTQLTGRSSASGRASRPRRRRTCTHGYELSVTTIGYLNIYLYHSHLLVSAHGNSPLRTGQATL